MRKLTEKQLQILNYIESNGGKDVRMNQHNLNQNINFFGRIKKLKEYGLITYEIDPGYISSYTITDLGRKALQTKVVNVGGKKTIIDQIRLLINKSNLSEDKKKHILTIIN